MKRKPRPESARTRERAAQRTQEKWSAERERLFALEPGGSGERPLEVASASVVETHALGVPCPRCLGPHELVEHAAVAHGGVRLREARLRCRQCGATRSMFFRLRVAAPN
jgi:transposase-like protein